MALSSLHAIELQLIMQLLPASDILQFARCSRTVHAAARSAFVFKYAQLDVYAGRCARPAAPVPVPAFLRLLLSALAAPFRPAATCVGPPPPFPAYLVPSLVLVWAPERKPVQMLAEEAVDMLLAVADRIGAVSRLHFMAGVTWSVTLSQWDRIFTHPSILHLRVLRLCREYLRHRPPEPPTLVRGQPRCDRLLARVCTLPHLHTLLELCDWLHVSLLEHLCSAPSLTRLSLVHDDSLPDHRPAVLIFGTLARCHKLLQLDLMCPPFLQPAFQSFLDSAVGRQLQCLTMRQLQCWPNAESAALFRDHFAALISLTRLELIQARNVDSVLPFVAAAPKLRLLIVESAAAQEETCPSAQIMTDLLAAAPTLHLTLRLPVEHRAALAGVRSERVVIQTVV